MAASARRDAEPTIWRIPDDLWVIVRHVLPAGELRRSRGRPWIDARRIVDGVLYVLRTGCQGRAVPREYGSGSTVHRRFQRWVEQGVWGGDVAPSSCSTMTRRSAWRGRGSPPMRPSTKPRQPGPGPGQDRPPMPPARRDPDHDDGRGSTERLVAKLRRRGHEQPGRRRSAVQPVRRSASTPETRSMISGPGTR